jgi:hypothetical protein
MMLIICRGGNLNIFVEFRFIRTIGKVWPVVSRNDAIFVYRSSITVEFDRRRE